MNTDFPCGKPDYLEEICAVCGQTRGVHNNMNQACPKYQNATRDNLEYARTVFAHTKSNETLLHEALQDLLEAIPKQDNNNDWHEDSLTKAINKATELLNRIK